MCVRECLKFECLDTMVNSKETYVNKKIDNWHISDPALRDLQFTNT